MPKMFQSHQLACQGKWEVSVHQPLVIHSISVAPGKQLINVPTGLHGKLWDPGELQCFKGTGVTRVKGHEENGKGTRTRSWAALGRATEFYSYQLSEREPKPPLQC